MIDHLTSFRAASKQHPLSFLYYSSATYSEFPDSHEVGGGLCLPETCRALQMDVQARIM